MSSVERSFRFWIDEDVKKDLLDMFDSDPDQAAVITVILEELRGDRSLCEQLIDVGYTDDLIKEVKEFKSLQRAGYNAYIVKYWEVQNWRVITAVDYQQRIIAILYIMDRSEEYDAVVQKHCKAAFDRLGL